MTAKSEKAQAVSPARANPEQPHLLFLSEIRVFPDPPGILPSSLKYVVFRRIELHLMASCLPDCLLFGARLIIGSRVQDCCV